VIFQLYQFVNLIIISDFTHPKSSEMTVDANADDSIVHLPKPVAFDSSVSGSTHADKRQRAIARALIKADQVTKLSVFCTRPAIFVLPHNIYVEFIGTFMLILGTYIFL
jgi:hypothetical protein